MKEDDGLVGEVGELRVDAGDDVRDVLLGLVGLGRRESDLDEHDLKNSQQRRDRQLEKDDAMYKV